MQMWMNDTKILVISFHLGIRNETGSEQCALLFAADVIFSLETAKRKSHVVHEYVWQPLPHPCFCFPVRQWDHMTTTTSSRMCCSFCSPIELSLLQSADSRPPDPVLWRKSHSAGRLILAKNLLSYLM
jgi:hypothetical protein